MEATIANVTEPGDTIVVAVNGFFGQRMAEIVRRHGGNVVQVDIPWGKPVTSDDLAEPLRKHRQVKAVTVVHAETSTGVLSPLPELAAMAHRHGALLLADTVTSLGGSALDMDGWDIDLCFSASQKCLGAPPGLSPVGISAQAMEVIRARKHKPYTWYLDLSLLERYWSQGASTPNRVYHHTAPVTMIYALREALRLLLEEGLENRFARHLRNASALRAGLRALGLKLLVEDSCCLPQLTPVAIPLGVEDAKVRQRLLREFNLEIGSGLGDLRGKAWRIGLMGESSTSANVLAVLSALEQVLDGEGFEIAAGAGVAAAQCSLVASA